MLVKKYKKFYAGYTKIIIIIILLGIIIDIILKILNLQ